MKKFLLTIAFAVMMCMSAFAQTQPDYMKAPKSNEKVLGVVSLETSWKGKNEQWSDQEVYLRLLEKAKKEFTTNRNIDIRNMEKEQKSTPWYEDGYAVGTMYRCNATGKVVYLIDPETQTKENLSQALNKALRNVREGSRLAIDQVTVISSMDRGEFKDQLIDVLLDKGYKVVAKEYLEKLYEEQQAQQSGIYNERTTVQENNFSAVGYYINVKVTETSVRVQVINVSTGEYEGNATVDF